MLRSEVQAKPRLVFRQYVESFLNGIKPKMTAGLKADLKTSGLDLDHPLGATYPAERMTEWAEKAAQHLFPGVRREEGLRQLGHLLIEGWQRTLLGKATAVVMSLVSPKQAVERTAEYFRGGNNYAEAKVVEHSACEYDIVMTEVNDVPWYYAGILEHGARLTKARDPHVTIVASTPPGATFKVRWSAETR
jgi:uncharacterized protein (TIGR02265 family)